MRSTWSIIDRQLRPKLGHILVRDLTTVMIDEFYASLRVDGAVEGGPLTPGSVRRIHGVLHRALVQAMRWEWIWSNPAASASPPRTEPVEMRPPSPEQVGELLDHVKAHLPLLHLFLILAATTGARRGQLLALKWVDVDFEHESLSFQRSWVEGPKGPSSRRRRRGGLTGLPSIPTRSSYSRNSGAGSPRSPPVISMPRSFSPTTQSVNARGIRTG